MSNVVRSFHWEQIRNSTEQEIWLMPRVLKSRELVVHGSSSQDPVVFEQQLQAQLTDPVPLDQVQSFSISESDADYYWLICQLLTLD